MAKVSIIVPVYNTEDYLSVCLDSLVNQTLSDIEIICVNDGSTDKSGEILKSYAQKDSRIKVINQENKKQGAARNNGVRFAQGEYIGYVDSDDWVDLDYYEKLYNTAKKYDSDLALATNVRVGNGKTKKRLELNEEKVYTELQEKLDICKQSSNECPTNKIYRRSFLEEYNIIWPENVYCEDKIYTLKTVYYANKIASVPNVQYYYYRNPTSTVNTRNTQHSKKLIQDKNNARKEVLNFLREHNAQIRDKEFWAIKEDKAIFGLTLLRIKESLKTEKYYLFGLIPCWIKSWD